MDELLNELNQITVDSTIEQLPMINNKHLQRLINALVIESKKRKERQNQKELTNGTI